MSSSSENAIAETKRPTPESAGAGGPQATLCRFYDIRQKYLTFVNTCNEKAAIARRAAWELSHLHPTPPALRLFCFVARRLESERALKDALGDLREAGVEQIMLVAGDQRVPSGKFSSTLEVLETGALSAPEFKRVGVCGHPEGHRAIGPTTLREALYDKQAVANSWTCRVAST